jgi:hypothetical protein
MCRQREVFIHVSNCIFIFFLLYLTISIAISRWAAGLARERGYSGRKWGVTVFLLMIGLIFWDWLPMELLYRYECSVNSGLYHEKSIDDWKNENPGVWDTLGPEKLPEEYFVKVKHGRERSKSKYYKLPDGTELIARYDIVGKHKYTDMVKDDGIMRFWLNQRFYTEYVDTNMLFHVLKEENRIVDYKTGEVIVTHVDYRTDIQPIGLGTDRLSDYKFWMQKASCQSGSKRKHSIEFNSIENHIQYAEK